MNRSAVMLAVINLLCAIAFPFIFERFLTDEGLKHFGLGFLIYIVLTTFEMALLLHSMRDTQVTERRTMERRIVVHNILCEIGEDFDALERTIGESAPVIPRLVRDRIERLRDEVHQANERRELYFDQYHMAAAPHVLRTFTEHRADTYSEVYRVWETKLFHLHDGDYFARMFELIQSGDLKEIRALIVVDPAGQAAMEKVATLVGFFAQHRGILTGSSQSLPT